MKYCSKCNYPNNDDAGKCFKCDSELAANIPEAMPLQDESAVCPKCGVQNDKSLLTCTACKKQLRPIKRSEYIVTLAVTFSIISVIVVGIIFLGKALSSEDNGKANNWNIALEAREAWEISQQFVRDNLKAPSTAKFAPYSVDNIVRDGKGGYRVDSYVDSENSFGAHIRTNYTCIVKKSGETWALEHLEFHDGDH